MFELVRTISECGISGQSVWKICNGRKVILKRNVFGGSYSVSTSWAMELHHEGMIHHQAHEKLSHIAEMLESLAKKNWHTSLLRLLCPRRSHLDRPRDEIHQTQKSISQRTPLEIRSGKTKNSLPSMSIFIDKDLLAQGR